MCSSGSLEKDLTELLANGKTRYSALLALQHMKHVAPAGCADAVVAALGDKDALTRQTAASTVGNLAEAVMQSSSAVGKLKELLKDSDSGVRAAAAFAVGAAG